MPAFDFLLPLKISVDGRGSDLTRAIKTLLPSIKKFVDPKLYDQFYVVSDGNEIEEIKSAFSPFNTHFNFVYVDEATLLPPILLKDERRIPRKGWYKQQIIKLQSDLVSNKDYVMVLDADIAVSRYLRFSDWMSKGKPRVHLEPKSAHPGWWQTSANILQLNADMLNEEEVLGVTPQCLSSRVLKTLRQELNRIAKQSSDKGWKRYLVDKCSEGDNNSWTEYSLYWLHLISRYAIDELYWQYKNNKTYRFLSASSDWHKTELNLHKYHIFSVLQSSEFKDDDVVQRLDNFLKPTAHYSESDSEYSLGESFEYVQRADVKKFLHNQRFWQVSHGGVGSNYFAELVGIKQQQKFYAELCHYPRPMKLAIDGLKAIYIFGDVYESVISQLSRDHQINIAKNNNISYPMSYCYYHTLDNYIQKGEDLFNLNGHIRTWVNAKHKDYPVLYLRFNDIPKYLPQICDYMALSGRQRESLISGFTLQRRESKFSQLNNQQKQGLTTIYSDLASYVDQLPSFFVK